MFTTSRPEGPLPVGASHGVHADGALSGSQQPVDSKGLGSWEQGWQCQAKRLLWVINKVWVWAQECGVPGLARAWPQLQSILMGQMGLLYFLGEFPQTDFELLEPHKEKNRTVEMLFL